MARIALLDYGMGNLRSVEKALERVGAKVTITSDAGVAAEADGLVLPGVGAFAKAMDRVRDLGLDRLVCDRLEAGTPVLGICLGYQLIFESSTELGGGDGLGLIAGDVVALDAPGLKVPHIGWEPVRWTRDSELTEGIPSGTPFYFVHGLTPRPEHERDVLATAEHGRTFACAISRGSLHGVQFHPEKSSAAGLRLLSNFAGVCARTSDLNSGGAPLRPSDSASKQPPQQRRDSARPSDSARTSRLNSGGAPLRPSDSASKQPPQQRRDSARPSDSASKPA